MDVQSHPTKNGDDWGMVRLWSACQVPKGPCQPVAQLSDKVMSNYCASERDTAGETPDFIQEKWGANGV
jgi:hypothetical protein